MTSRVTLWGAINRYATSVGGDPSQHVYGNALRMQAVADVEAAIDKLIATPRAPDVAAAGVLPAARSLPKNPDCTGTVGKDFVACGEAGYYCSDRCWTIGRLEAARALVVEYERQLGIIGAGSDARCDGEGET